MPRRWDDKNNCVNFVGKREQDCEASLNAQESQCLKYPDSAPCEQRNSPALHPMPMLTATVSSAFFSIEGPDYSSLGHFFHNSAYQLLLLKATLMPPALPTEQPGWRLLGLCVWKHCLCSMLLDIMWTMPTNSPLFLVSPLPGLDSYLVGLVNSFRPSKKMH